MLRETTPRRFCIDLLVFKALKDEKDSVCALRGFLKDREARLERAEIDAAEVTQALTR